jgi:hypothetical protein
MRACEVIKVEENPVASKLESAQLTRRQWLGQLSLPAVGAALGAGILGEKRMFAASKATSTDDLGTRVYNVRAFGAKGEGVAVDSAAFQAAIDACTKEGGGTVLVPAGTFVIGTVELKSNVSLHIAAGAKVLGSADGKQYHAVDAIPLHGDSTLEDGNWALFFAVDAKNVTVEGPGTIDGQGGQFHSAVRGTPPPSGIGGNMRPYQILVYRCEDFVVRDLSLLDCAYHSIRVIQSKRVHMDGLYIHDRVNSNNDGFHFISAEYVTVTNCTVLSQDDACALFGSCKFVTVTNCVFSTRWSVFRFGGGVAENITVSNCILYEVYGCPIKFHGRPGSRYENMSFSNLVLKDVTGPIHISMGPSAKRVPGVSGAQPQANPEPEPADPSNPAIVRNISFSNIHGTVTTDPPQLRDATFTSNYNPGERRSCIALSAVGGSIIEDVSFDNVHLTFGGGGTAEDAARRNLPQIAGEYFMLGPMPAYGFYARNSRGITLNNVRFQVAAPDLRPALVFDHVEDAAISALTVQGNASAESVLRFTASRDVLFTGTRVLTPSPAFLQLEGTENERITIDGGDLSKSSSVLAFKDGAGASSVKLRQ